MFGAVPGLLFLDRMWLLTLSAVLKDKPVIDIGYVTFTDNLFLAADVVI